MITPKTQYSLSNAKEYFREHLAHGDYYSEKQSVAGEWIGQGAEMLGLSGQISEREFLAMCEGMNPKTGQRLTARMNTVREVNGIKQANRRVFFDFVFRPPKSVSLVALCHDERVIALHTAAVREALHELEKFAATRIRRDGERGQRTTGNFAAALFTHDSSRALDPLLHTHAVVFNATFDSVEQRWKALENSDMLKAQKLVSAAYDAKLTAGLAELGYRIRREGTSYEIETVQRPTIEKFSKRRREIERLAAVEAQKRGEGVNVFTIRDQVAHEHRARKIKDANAQSLRDLWMGAMTVEELGSLRPSGERVVVDKAKALAEATRIADGMLFDRRSVVEKHELEAAILHEAIGTGATLADVRPVVETGERYVRDADGREFTSPASLAAEMAVLVAARDGRNTLAPVNPNFDLSQSRLDPEQRAAVKHIAESRDFITLFRGAAGTGKSTTLKEVGEMVKAAGVPLVVVAPGTGQVRDLQADGLPAQTLARLLKSRDLAAGAVVLLDEGGQVGARSMRDLCAIVKQKGGRIVISGDTRQHGAVEASDALLAIEKFAGLQAAEIKTIRRQDPKRAASEAEAAEIEAYRRAVFAASDGDIAISLHRLEKLGAVHEVKDAEKVNRVASAVVDELAAGVDVLAVSQTRAEALSVNEAVTAACIDRGLVSDAVRVTTIVPRDLMPIEKQLARTYSVGDEIQFIGRYGANKVGDVRKVVHVTDDALMLEAKPGELKATRLSLKYGELWNVIDRRDVTLGAGSRVQLKLNASTAEGERLVNGEICTVRRILRDGRMVLEDGRGVVKTLAPDQRVMLPGYCVTSYGSQGKSVESVILADSGSRQATSQREWYVSISRAKRRIKIFTSDVESLRDRIQARGEEKLAVELRRKPAKRRLRRVISSARRLRLAQRLSARLGRKLTQIVKQKSAHLWHGV